MKSNTFNSCCVIATAVTLSVQLVAFYIGVFQWWNAMCTLLCFTSHVSGQYWGGKERKSDLRSENSEHLLLNTYPALFHDLAFFASNAFICHLGFLVIFNNTVPVIQSHLALIVAIPLSVGMSSCYRSAFFGYTFGSLYFLFMLMRRQDLSWAMVESIDSGHITEEAKARAWSRSLPRYTWEEYEARQAEAQEKLGMDVKDMSEKENMGDMVVDSMV